MMLEQVLESLDKAVVDDVRIYDMTGKSPLFDYTIVCSVNSSRQGFAAADYIKSDALKAGINVRGFSASDQSGWFLVDLGDIVVHIFVGEEREFYNLDGMYANNN